MSATPTHLRKPAAHLIHLIQATKSNHPNFVLFLGAGASAESGVKTAREMVADWRTTYCNLYGDGTTDFIDRQSWSNSPTEYSRLFEALYDQPSQRREYIEQCIDSANPSWGYIYLVDLIRKGVFNTVFTTNFDDLLNEACYLYSTDVRPIVCAHDSSIRSVRITTKRPKIVKLHGDFLFDSIKNTVRELESLESNMRDKLKQYAVEYGMIVLGYAGNDRSIMDTMDALLRNDDSFPHGVYWCVRKGAIISEAVDSLCRFPRFHLVEIEGFNGFFSELYASLSDAPHPIFSNPYGVASEKLGSLLGSLRAPSGKVEFQKSLARDISLLGKSIQQIPKNDGVTMPHQVLAWNDLVQGNMEGAISHLQKDLKRGLTKENVEMAINILKTNWSNDLAEALVGTMEQNKYEKSYGPTHVNNLAIDLMHMGQYDFAERALKSVERVIQVIGGVHKDYFLINQAQIYRHKAEAVPEKHVSALRKLTESSPNTLSKYGAYIVLNECAAAVALVTTNFVDGNVEGVSVDTILGWPITKLLQSDHRAEIVALKTKKEAGSPALANGTSGTNCLGPTPSIE